MPGGTLGQNHLVSKRLEGLSALQPLTKKGLGFRVADHFRVSGVRWHHRKELSVEFLGHPEDSLQTAPQTLNPKASGVLELLIDLCFVLDILLTFRTSYSSSCGLIKPVSAV